jgi:hypothetical protein
MYASIYLFMHACIYAVVYSYVCVCMYASIQAFKDVCVCMYVHICVMCTYVYMAYGVPHADLSRLGASHGWWLLRWSRVAYGMALNIYDTSVRNLLHFTLLPYKISRWHLHLSKNYGDLVYGLIFGSSL